MPSSSAAEDAWGLGQNIHKILRIQHNGQQVCASLSMKLQVTSSCVQEKRKARFIRDSLLRWMTVNQYDSIRTSQPHNTTQTTTQDHSEACRPPPPPADAGPHALQTSHLRTWMQLGELAEQSFCMEFFNSCLETLQLEVTWC